MDFYNAAVFIVCSLVFVPCVSGSVKKGVAIGSREFLCDDFLALNNIYWWYDWRFNLRYYHQATNCTHIDVHQWNHVPMVWGWPPRDPLSVPTDAMAVLGFNEPNFYSQAKLTAQEAAAHWPDIEKHAHAHVLVSPAAAPCGNPSRCYGDVYSWFGDFFKYCDNCRVDFLATHAYFCDARHTIEYLRGLYDRYGKQIWLTEFACPHTTDEDVQLRYMREVLPLLEGADFVYRYAWFVSRITHSGFVTTTASLLEPNSSTLTPLGEFYNNFQGTHIATKMTKRHIFIIVTPHKKTGLIYLFRCITKLL